MSAISFDLQAIAAFRERVSANTVVFVKEPFSDSPEELSAFIERLRANARDTAAFKKFTFTTYCNYIKKHLSRLPEWYPDTLDQDLANITRSTAEKKARDSILAAHFPGKDPKSIKALEILKKLSIDELIMAGYYHLDLSVKKDDLQYEAGQKLAMD